MTKDEIAGGPAGDGSQGYEYQPLPSSASSDEIGAYESATTPPGKRITDADIEAQLKKERKGINRVATASGGAAGSVMLGFGGLALIALVFGGPLAALAVLAIGAIVAVATGVAMTRLVKPEGPEKTKLPSWEDEAPRLDKRIPNIADELEYREVDGPSAPPQSGEAVGVDFSGESLESGEVGVVESAPPSSEEDRAEVNLGEYAPSAPPQSVRGRDSVPDAYVPGQDRADPPPLEDRPEGEINEVAKAFREAVYGTGGTKTSKTIKRAVDVQPPRLEGNVRS